MWGRTAIAEILTLGPDAPLPRRWGSTCAWWGGWTTAPPVTPRLSPPRAAAPTTWASWITAPATTSARPGTPSATARRVSGAGTGLPRGDAGRDAPDREGGAWAAGGGSGALRGASRRSLADVTCVCPDGFVGDGTWCRGRLPDVLAEDARFSTFYSVSDAPGAGPWRGRPGLPAVLMGSFPAAARFCQRLGRRAGVFHLFVRRLRSQNAFCPSEFWLRGERGTRPRGGRGSRGAAGLRAAPAPSSPARSPQTLSGEELQLHASALLLFSFDLTAGTAVPSRAGRDLRVSALPPGNGSARSVGPTSARSPPPLPPAPRVRNAGRPLPLCSPAAGNHGDRRLRRRGVGHRGRQRRHPRPRRAAAAAPARGAARAGEWGRRGAERSVRPPRPPPPAVTLRFPAGGRRDARCRRGRGGRGGAVRGAGGGGRRGHRVLREAAPTGRAVRVPAGAVAAGRETGGERSPGPVPELRGGRRGRR